MAVLTEEIVFDLIRFLGALQAQFLLNFKTLSWHCTFGLKPVTKALLKCQLYLRKDLFIYLTSPNTKAGLEFSLWSAFLWCSFISFLPFFRHLFHPKISFVCGILQSISLPFISSWSLCGKELIPGFFLFCDGIWQLHCLQRF